MATGRARVARTVGRYELVHELSQSYLGPLWAVRVEGANAGSELAMLRLVSLARLDADTRVRLLEAAWQAMEVRDPGVCSVTDVVASDGELGVVAEYAEGVTLRALASFASVRRKPAPAPVSLKIVLDLLSAVAAMHRTTAELGDEAVALYGGLSADSVLIGAAGRTLVLDVAVASAASPVESIGGNPERAAYAAPEQLGSPARADARTDVFATGVLAWELLGSRRLFVGSDKAVVQKVLTSRIPRPDELRRKGDPEIPPGIVAVVMKALERDPEKRYATAEALTAALLECGVTPATEAAVAEYVENVAEGALSRAREALRRGSSGTRAAVPTRQESKMAPVAASPSPKRTESKPRMPAVQAPKAGPPASVDPRAPARPPLPARSDAKPPLPARVEQKPQFRARQPTMIGIPAPAVLTPKGDEPARPEPLPKMHASPSRPRTDSEAAIPTPPAPPSAPLSMDAAVESIPPSSVDVEPGDGLADEGPTGQYSSRELVRHVEAMGRPSKRPSDTPAVLPTPPPSDFPEPVTAPRLENAPHLDALPRLDESPSMPPIAGGWLDDPASIPPPPPSTSSVDRDALTPDDPVELGKVARAAIVAIGGPPSSGAESTLPAGQKVPVAAIPPPPSREPAPPIAVPAAPLIPSPAMAAPAGASFPPRGTTPRPASTSLAPAAPRQPSTPPPPGPSAAYLPSQIPPPLFHDPRARSATRRRAAGEDAATGPKGTLLGLGLSLVLVLASALLGFFVLRSRDAKNTAEEAARAAAVATATTAAAPETTAAATPSAAPEPTTLVAAPSASAAEAPAEPETAAPAASAAPAEPAPQTTAIAHPAPVQTQAPAVRRAAPAKPKPAAKKKARYVPDDI